MINKKDKRHKSKNSKNTKAKTKNKKQTKKVQIPKPERRRKEKGGTEKRGWSPVVSGVLRMGVRSAQFESR